VNTQAPANTVQTRPRGPPRTRDGHRGAPPNRRPWPTAQQGGRHPGRIGWGLPELGSSNRDRRECTGRHGSSSGDHAAITTVMITSGVAPALALYTVPTSPQPRRNPRLAGPLLQYLSWTRRWELAARCKGAAHGWRIASEQP